MTAASIDAARRRAMPLPIGLDPSPAPTADNPAERTTAMPRTELMTRCRSPASRLSTAPSTVTRTSSNGKTDKKP
jgi:hypothetical protein